MRDFLAVAVASMHCSGGREKHGDTVRRSASARSRWSARTRSAGKPRNRWSPTELAVGENRLAPARNGKVRGRPITRTTVVVIVRGGKAILVEAAWGATMEREKEEMLDGRIDRATRCVDDD